MTNKAIDKIIKAKVHLQKENPFFSYLVMNLKLKESEEVKSMGVDSYGNCYYNAKWVETLSDNETKSVLCHEVLHIALEHLSRVGNRKHDLFNVATDLAINHMLVTNGFEFGTELTKYSLIPHWASYTFQNGYRIENLDKKSAEEIYAELEKLKQFQEQKSKVCVSGKGSNGQSGEEERNPFGEKRFDDHEYSKETNTSKTFRENEKKWKRVLTEASVYAKQCGKLPTGIEKLVDCLLDEKVSWKQILYKYITNTLPYDYTYKRPSKKSISSGFYMPSILKEDMDIVVSIDTSGSIRQEELSEFLSEIINIAKSFNNINMKLIVCDCEIKDVYRVANGDIAKIQDLKIRGGGGTDHRPIYQYIREELPNTKFVINFTDGYTSFPNSEETKTIWVLTKNACNDDNIPFGDIIRIE